MTNGLSDGELLARFNRRDHAAFEELIRRHGSLVAKVCRRITQNAHDAEDAMQRVFSALAARASTLSEHPSLAGWLYTTAWQISLDARRKNIRRRVHEQAIAIEANPGKECELERAESLYELYRAIGMLPTEYRLIVVLHHLEGLTLSDISRMVQQPLGTVAARVSRGRAMIRERMARRGEALSVAALAEVLRREEEAIETGPVTINDLLIQEEVFLPPVDLKAATAAWQTAAVSTSAAGSSAAAPPLSAGAFLVGLLQGRAAIAGGTLLAVTGIAAASPSARQWIAEKAGFAESAPKPPQQASKPPISFDFSFGGGSSHRTVPEPGTISLVGFGVVGLMRRRRF